MRKDKGGEKLEVHICLIGLWSSMQADRGILDTNYFQLASDSDYGMTIQIQPYMCHIWRSIRNWSEGDGEDRGKEPSRYQRSYL